MYYGESRRRSLVEFSPALRDELRRITAEMHELFRRGYTPKVKPSKKCKACSLEELCVPKLQRVAGVREYIQKEIRADG